MAVKTINGLGIALVKTVNNLAISSVKTVNGLTTVSGPVTYLSDTFVDTDGTSLAAHTMNIGSGWTISLDGLGCSTAIDHKIQSNKAVADAGIYSIAWAEAGVSDAVASVDMDVPNSNNYLRGLLFRYVSCSGFWTVGIERDGGGTPYMAIYKITSGSASAVASVNVPAATNSTINVKVTLSGNSIVALASTGETCNTTDSTYNTGTKFGLFGYKDGGYNVSTPCSNFLVTN